MDPLLKLLKDDARLSTAELASLLQKPQQEIEEAINRYQSSNVILGYKTVINEEKLDLDNVRAVIEVKITPEREGGFDRVAQRISKYREVTSCFLMSGSYDLLVITEGSNLHQVASFVSEKLATIQGVLSTATHFMLKPYKEQGILMTQEIEDSRLPVTP